jgi:REP element-mobilizing transposase RayT
VVYTLWAQFAIAVFSRQIMGCTPRRSVIGKMPVRPEFNPDYLYFVTTKAIKFAKLFERDVNKRILVDSFHHLRTSGRMNLFAFVIMPNHIRLIGKFSEGHTLSDVLRDFKKFTARQVYR